MAKIAGVIGLIGGVLAVVVPLVGWVAMWLRTAGVAFTSGLAADLAFLTFLAGGVLGPLGLVAAMIGGTIALLGDAKALGILAWLHVIVALVSWLLLWLMAGASLLEGFAWA